MKTRHLGLADYHMTWEAMRAFTDERADDTEDELWVCEHPPVYTLGQAGRESHIHNPADIPVVKSDRGGQVTYHGPGQVVVYTLISLRRAGFGIREMVERLENSVIALLKMYDVTAVNRRDAPGVYVNGAKIAALGLRVRRGSTYHGLALNINPDLAPFSGIDPCGFANLAVTSTEKLGIESPKAQIVEQLILELHKQLAAPVLDNSTLS
ncbi:MAG: lipoyl(octanoyl) transferase LipB [Granulosicoccus sp.]